MSFAIEKYALATLESLKRKLESLWISVRNSPVRILEECVVHKVQEIAVAVVTVFLSVKRVLSNVLFASAPESKRFDLFRW